jgi:hypothetical protein
MAESVNQNASTEIIDLNDRQALGIAGRGHDIGHGPFSHLFEKVTKQYIGKDAAHHENWGKRILDEDEELQKITSDHREIFDVVNKIFNKLHQPVICDIISSELDADRFDYLLRDSLMTGVKYANLDLAWILRCLIPAEKEIHRSKKNILALDATRGTSVVEAYVLGRHYMYRHVYYHKTTRAAEQMLRRILQHATDEVAAGKRKSPHAFFDELAAKSASVANYLKLDDFLLLGYVDEWATGNDDLAKACKRLQRRQVFKTHVHHDHDKDAEPKLEAIRKIARKKGFNPDLFVIPDDPSDIALKSPDDYKKKGEGHKYQPLYFIDGDRKLIELAETKSFVNDLEYEERRVYVPEELLRDVKDVWK